MPNIEIVFDETITCMERMGTRTIGFAYEITKRHLQITPLIARAILVLVIIVPLPSPSRPTVKDLIWHVVVYSGERLLLAVPDTTL